MKKNVWKLLAAILSVAVILSLSTITVFADTPADTESSSETGDADGAAADTTANTAADTDADTSADTAADTSEAEDEHDHESESTSSGAGNYWIPTLIILAVILIGCAIWVFTDRERAMKLWRSFKSEFKKVVWYDPHDTLKSTVLVVIAILVFAAVLGVIDYLLSAGIVGLGKII